MSSNIRITRVCEYCGKDFEARTTVTRCCSDHCAKRAYKARKKKDKIQASQKEVTKIKVQPIEEIKAKEFLTVREASKLLGISVRTVYRAIERKDLQPGKIGKRTILKRSDIDNLFK